MSDPVEPMQSATERSVPSPPSTTTMSTLSTTRCFSAIASAGGGGVIRAAVAVS